MAAAEAAAEWDVEESDYSMVRGSLLVPPMVSFPLPHVVHTTTYMHILSECRCRVGC